ncbi:MAG TPA: cytochrome c [Methylophilaceae bacterium]|nr:cytochrome c [Methylophilaceae bacterium]HQR60941.1 cytochrome c [Methylophilaceae bacterium]
MSVREISRGLGPAFFLGWIAFFSVGADAGEEVNQQRQRELVRLVRNDCGSCHGLKLGGGLGPSLLPAALAGKAPGALRETIQQGRAGTAMPPWSRFLSEAEANWIVEQLMKGFPDVQ